MKITRPAFVLGGMIACLLLVSVDTATAQTGPPPVYLFVEVKDTAGQKITDATIAIPGGDRDISHKTNADGFANAGFNTRWGATAFDLYTLQVSKPGYLPYEDVIFLYPYTFGYGSFFGRVEELSNSLENQFAALHTRTQIVLRKEPTTAAERRAVELEERQHQLLLAIKRSDLASVRKWLQAGVKPDTADARGIPAIAWAVLAGDAEIIKALLDAGANVRNKSSPAHQALLIYLSEGIPRERGRLGIGRDAPSYRPPLPLADKRYEEIVRRLIKAGAGVNLPRSYRGTALANAVALALINPYTPYILSIEVAKLLIAAGADVNAAGAKGETPLMAAAARGDVETIKMLLDAGAGASINAKDDLGYTALIHLYRYNPFYQMDYILAGNATWMDSTEKDQLKVLALVLAKDFTTASKMLLAAGALVAAKDNEGDTALTHVCSYPFCADPIKTLIQAGAPINAQSRWGRTALMQAVSRNYPGENIKVPLLLAAGADVSLKDYEGRTALMIALREHANAAVIKLLEEAESRR